MFWDPGLYNHKPKSHALTKTRYWNPLILIGQRRRTNVFPELSNCFYRRATQPRGNGGRRAGWRPKHRPCSQSDLPLTAGGKASTRSLRKAWNVAAPKSLDLICSECGISPGPPFRGTLCGAGPASQGRSLAASGAAWMRGPPAAAWTGAVEALMFHPFTSSLSGRAGVGEA